jgi:hypothetical protein
VSCVPSKPDPRWFLVLVLLTIVLSIVAIEIPKTGFPVYGYFLSIAIPFLYVIPAAFIYAMTGSQVSLAFPPALWGKLTMD